VAVLAYTLATTSHHLEDAVGGTLQIFNLDRQGAFRAMDDQAARLWAGAFEDAASVLMDGLFTDDDESYNRSRDLFLERLERYRGEMKRVRGSLSIHGPETGDVLEELNTVEYMQKRRRARKRRA
jgi:hypothetical protein